MVVGSAPVVAMLPVPADIAIPDRIRIRLGRGLRRGGGCEARSHEAVVGAEVGRAVRLLLEGRHDVEVLRLQALRRGQQLAVRAELQDGGGPSLAREFRIHGLIRVRAEVLGRGFAAQEDVGDPVERLVFERRLDDGVASLAHRGDRRGWISRIPQVANRAAGGAQLREIRLLVLAAAFLECLEPRIGKERDVERPRAAAARAA